VRRGLTWAITLPLVLGGTEAAHTLAYRLVYPQTHVRVLLATGHAYLAWLPLALALAGALAVAALAAAATDAARGRPVGALPAWAFALLPALFFALQELLELSLRTGTFGWRAVLAPTFLPGLALQLPLALAAYLAAAVLLRTAVRLGRRLLATPRARARRAEQLDGTSQLLARLSSADRTSRGPPVVVAAA